MKTMSKLLVFSLVLCLVGCTTVATFKLPQGTEMRVMNREAEFQSGTITTTPFPWKAAGRHRLRTCEEGQGRQVGKIAGQVQGRLDILASYLRHHRLAHGVQV